MMFGLGESFRYLTCPDCGTLFIREVPDDLAAYYSTKYYSFDLDPEVALGRPGVRQLVRLLGRSTLFGSGRASRAARTVPVRQLRTLLTLLESVRLAGLPEGRDTRVLDVGSGTGALVFALGLAGLRQVTGVDPFNEADRTLSTGAAVLRRTVEEVVGTFDLVMLHHSFEHVPDPRATLEAVAGRLSPTGRVLVRMPTVSSAAYERYGRDWIQLDPPRHLTLFSREGMETLARRTGFTVDAVADDSSSFQFWGSEQARSGTSLMAPDSHFVNAAGSAFARGQLRAWDREADELNRAGLGDQAAWVLRRTAAG
jgi:SAM-dependent methyltransferase